MTASNRARHRNIARNAPREGIEQNAATLVIRATHAWLNAYAESHHGHRPDPAVWSVAVPVELHHPIVRQWNPDDSAALTVTPDGLTRVFGFPLLFLDRRNLHACGPLVHVLDLRLSDVRR